VNITWTAFPLHPETPEEGRTLEDLFAGQNMDIPKMIAHLQKTAAGLGLPFGDRHDTFNSRKAQELGKWAETLGRGDPFHHAAFSTYFADGKNIANLKVLADIAGTAGLPGNEVADIIETGRFSRAVDEDWQRSRDLGIRVVPTFRSNGRKMEGAKSYEALLQFVQAQKTENRRIF
jgi:predicted DsbA family dithiol-disulfide isomerase